METDHLVWFIIGACAAVGVSVLAAVILAAIGLADSPLGRVSYVD